MSKFNYQGWINKKAGWALDYGDEAKRMAEEGAYEFGKGIVDCPDENGEKAIAYLKSCGVTDIAGRLTDDLYAVALIEEE